MELSVMVIRLIMMLVMVVMLLLLLTTLQLDMLLLVAALRIQINLLRIQAWKLNPDPSRYYEQKFICPNRSF